MPPGPTTRAISATPLAGSGTKKITSGITAASNVLSENGSAIASPWRNCATRDAGRVRAKASCASDGSMPSHRDRRTPLDDHFRKRAVAAADVEPSQTGFRSQPVEKGVAGKLAPLPHVSFVAGTVGEADLVGHPGLFLRPRRPMLASPRRRSNLSACRSQPCSKKPSKPGATRARASSPRSKTCRKPTSGSSRTRESRTAGEIAVHIAESGMMMSGELSQAGRQLQAQVVSGVHEGIRARREAGARRQAGPRADAEAHPHRRRTEAPAGRRTARPAVHHAVRRGTRHPPRLDEPRHLARGVPSRPARALRAAGGTCTGTHPADLRQDPESAYVNTEHAEHDRDFCSLCATACSVLYVSSLSFFRGQ